MMQEQQKNNTKSDDTDAGAQDQHEPHKRNKTVSRNMSELCSLARTMCSVDLAESCWIQELPQLPVPDLWLTSSRYLASLRAVLSPREMRPDETRLGSWPRELAMAKRKQFEQTELIVKEFMLNEGPELQRDLKEYASKCQNWATDFWLKDMYLSNALPLPVNSNPFFMFPKQEFSTSEQMLMFATRIIQFSVDFKYRIDQQTLTQDFGSGHGKGKPLCMATYKNFFHSYRMPHEDVDRLLPQSRRSNHIVVASCNQFYILRLGQEPLDNPYKCDAGAQLGASMVFDQLLRIYRVSREHARRELNGNAADKMPRVGLFTTENRKTWAKLHKQLSHLSGDDATNINSLRQIEDCLFVMCLDSLVTQNGDKASDARDDQTDLEQAANVILTGAGASKFTANRWFDKFLQVIVGRDGICGINIEHSASEGITVLRFLEEFVEFLRANPIANAHTNNTASAFDFGSTTRAQCTESITSPAYVEPKSPSALLSETDTITPLTWRLDEELRASLDEAEARAEQLVRNFSLRILEFQQFGRAFIKSQSLSPDAFVQLALQYTFYKLHGQLVCTYESASLRQFRLGRVDNIRANTCEAYEWIEAMLECKRAEPLKWSERAQAAFIKAITRQVEILRYTITGGGPDNHLLALKELARVRFDELPDLFLDNSYREHVNFRLSTSQLPTDSGITVGYGAVVHDGYGCSYNPREDRITFCVSSFVDCEQTSSSRFASTLVESLCEMRDLCESRQRFDKQGRRRASFKAT